MKKYTFVVLLFVSAFLTLQAFTCGRPGINDNCQEIVSDTVYMPFNILNPAATYNVGDTIKLFSKINDTVNSVRGKSFVFDRNIAYAGVQVYKVINTNGVKELNYANIEFNPIVNTGQFQGYPNNGFNYIYSRGKPYNNLQISFVAGKAGLYFFNLNEQFNGNYIRENNNYCANYASVPLLSIANQQKNYWDTLGVSSIKIANSGGYPIFSKAEKNYFFVKVNP